MNYFHKKIYLESYPNIWIYKNQSCFIEKYGFELDFKNSTHDHPIVYSEFTFNYKIKVFRPKIHESNIIFGRLGCEVVVSLFGIHF